MDVLVNVVAVIMSIILFSSIAFILLYGHDHPGTSERPSGGKSWWDKDPPFS